MIPRSGCFVLFLLTHLAVSLCTAQVRIEVRDDLKKHFEAFKVDGSFALYNLKKKEYLLCNQDQFKKAFIPASTFKICNSMIALESGVIRDENVLLKWDGIVRPVEAWNHDQDMKSAFKNSTVWFYQELARKVGGRRMKYWLDKANYGNADTSGGIDVFWLRGGLRITPEQQIDFLRKLYTGSLPFSRRTMDIVKRMMIVQDSSDFTLRAKTGWSSQDSLQVGWYVGYLQKADDVYFFSTCIQTPNSSNPDFAKARAEITLRILRDLRLL